MDRGTPGLTFGAKEKKVSWSTQSPILSLLSAVIVFSSYITKLEFRVQVEVPRCVVVCF